MKNLTFAWIVRIAVAIVGAVLVLAGLVAIGAGEPAGGLWALVAGGVILFAAVLEVTRYRPESNEGERGPDFEPTSETFLDPTTGQRMRVWFDPRTGQRRYEPDSADG